MIIDSFMDILKHTHGLGFIELVKLTGDDKSVTIEAMDPDKSVVVNGTLNTPIDKLEGTIGLSRLSVLSGYINYPPFSSDNANSGIVKHKVHDTPFEIKFDSKAGHVSHYRFMAESVANDQIKVPPFKGATWNVEIEPTKRGLRDLATMNGILGSFESVFSVQTVNNNLEFSIGAAGSDRTKLVFAEDVQGVLAHTWSWPLSQVLSILKLQDTSKSCKMSFSDQGALKIEIDSEMGTYQYILPARS